ncbi:filamentous hemagglutinin N-terminal domain-containing protein [Cupriavidus sp. H19C3]|uniref:filamentous hemagglutinin N-terminal domain-containing protein n=1 Tax=Cupriavidus sp. H19C3 TaxID=3241603 RepID=UPI003BF87E11
MAVLGQNQSDGGDIVALGATQARVAGNDAGGSGAAGIAIVDIADANAAGVSHNRYAAFHVGPAGVVLNNTVGTGPAALSQLAGQVGPNRGMTRAAALILNEVVSPGRSRLAGFIEVLGRPADVVVANPAGITCAGCGFINTGRATLTTGVPLLDRQGALAGFRVGQGDILIEGDGLDASTQPGTDLIARLVRLEGPVHARDLGIVAGRGVVATEGGAEVGTEGGTERVPERGPDAVVADAVEPVIDSSALGGMYADRIRLIARGGGVRLAGNVVAKAGDIDVAAAGDIGIGRAATLFARRDLRLATGPGKLDLRAIPVPERAGAVVNEGRVLAGNDLRIAAGGRLFNAATLQAREGMAVRTNTLVNHGAIEGGTVDIVATTVRNEVAGGDPRIWMTTRWKEAKDGETVWRWHGLSSTYRYYQNYKATRVRQQRYWRTPGKSPHIVADRRLALAFSELHNLGGTLASGDAMRLQGFVAMPAGGAQAGDAHAGGNAHPVGNADPVGHADPKEHGPDMGLAHDLRDDRGNRFRLQGATLVNDSLALETQHIARHRTMTRRDLWILLGTARQFDWLPCGGPAGEADAACAYQGTQETVQSTFQNLLRAGISARHLAGSGFSIHNRGVPTGDLAAVRDDTLPDVAEIASPAARALGGRAGDLGDLYIRDTPPRSRYLLARNPLYPLAAGASAVAGGRPATAVASTEPSDPDAGPAAPAAATADGITDGVSDGARHGADPGLHDGAGAGARHGLAVSPPSAAPTTEPPTEPPTEPRHDTARPPLAAIATDTGQPAAPAVDTDYLANRLGLAVDAIGLRLGDADYEQRLVRDQWLARTGAMAPGIETGRWMQTLMDNAARAAGPLGLVYGRALTSAQAAALPDDIVWAVRTDVAAREVLVPVVYLSPQTHARLARGAWMRATTVDIAAGEIRNDGGEIAAGESLALRTAGDLVNTSGVLAGREVALRAGRKLVNQTFHRGGGGEQAYASTLGGAGTIAAAAQLSLAAGGDLVNLGAAVRSDGDVALAAGGQVVFDTIAVQSARSTTTGRAGPGAGTMQTQATRQLSQMRSQLVAGGDIAMRGETGTVLAGTHAVVGGNADLRSGAAPRARGAWPPGRGAAGAPCQRMGCGARAPWFDIDVSHGGVDPARGEYAGGPGQSRYCRARGCPHGRGHRQGRWPDRHRGAQCGGTRCARP